MTIDTTYLDSDTDSIMLARPALLAMANKTNESVSVLDFGAVGDGVTDDTVAIQAAITASINSSLHFPKGNYLISAGLDFTAWSGVVFGAGVIVCKPSTTIANVLYFGSSTKVNWSGVSLDMGQTAGTLTGGARSDSGFYLLDARDCTFSNFNITNCKFGEPIYVNGTSSVSPSASAGSRRIFFSDINCVALPASTLDDGAFINVRSDFYTATGGGLYAAASNGCKESDYTLDASVAYQRTTQDVYFTNCHFENLDRFALYNVKGVHLSNVSLVNSYTRGLTMSPSCESVTWVGGKVSGNAAQINANYACKDISISDLVALGETVATGQRHALRCGFGSERIKFKNITGSGNDTRHVFIEGARDVTFEGVSLNQWTGGNTTVAVSIAGGGSGNTSSWVTDRIRFIGCDFSANYAFRFDDNAGTATVAAGAVVCDESTDFNIGISFYNGAAPAGGKILYHGSGSWSPTLAGATVAGAHTFTAAGRFRRKGDLVFVDGTILLTAKDAAMSGVAGINGLPFASAAGTNQNGALALGYWAGLTFPVNYTQPGLLIPPATSRISIWRFGSGQAAQQSNSTECGATTSLVFSGCYVADV